MDFSVTDLVFELLIAWKRSMKGSGGRWFCTPEIMCNYYRVKGPTDFWGLTLTWPLEFQWG